MRPDPQGDVTACCLLSRTQSHGDILVPSDVEKVHLSHHLDAHAAHSKHCSFQGGTRGRATTNKAWHVQGMLLQ